ncbi:MAG TPA: hypothetical protein VG477_04345 [Thermoanaerobaculia bacterium]|nr:hypothetical protein [Thermoanaerobaculia bacterium]
MNPSNARVLVFATALLAAPLFEATAAQGPRHQRPQQTKPQPKEPQVVIKETPIEEDSQAQATQNQGQPAQPQDQQGATAPQDPAAAPAQDPSAAQPGAVPAGKVTPEQMGVSFAAPQGWQPVDPNSFTLPGDVCCAWKPGELASIVAFVQRPGRAFLPRVLLDETAKAFKNPPLSAQVQREEVVTIGGKRAFSLVITAGGNGAAIDGKGAIPTTQHWVAIPREQDVILFLMTTPADKFEENEKTFQAVLNSMQVSGTQTAEQQASQ